MFVLVFGLAVPPTTAMAAGKSKKKEVLVVYFSATGTTKAAAKKVKKATGGKLYRIKAADPYTDADLDYSTDCRANDEQNDENARPEIKGEIKNIKNMMRPWANRCPSTTRVTPACRKI